MSGAARVSPDAASDAGGPMIDAVERVTGRIRYTIDVAVPGMLHAALVRSPIARGTIVELDAEAARRVPGVVAVITAAELTAAGLGEVRFGGVDADRSLLAMGRVCHVGEPVAAVVATHVGMARSAAELVRLRIDREVPVLTAEDALAPGAPRVHPDRDNVLKRWLWEHGDLDRARAMATHRFEDTYSSPAAQQLPMEPHVCVARWSDGGVEVWSGTQSPSAAAQDLANAFGLSLEAVRVHVAPLGGGFGGKNKTAFEPLVVALSRLVGQPVRLANTRGEEFVTVTKHATRVRLESGVDRDGQFLYRAAEIVMLGGAYALSSAAVSRSAGLSVCGPYRVPVARVESTVVYTNHPPAGSFRGLGVNQAAWAGEQQVDVIAAELGIDPVELRRRNLVEPGGRLFTGERVADAHWRECLDAVAANLGEPSAGIPSEVPADVRRGRGVAVVMKQTISPSRSEADIVLDAGGKFEVRTSAVDMGQGARTVLTRLAAHALEVSVDRIRLVDPDTRITPYDETSSSSRLTHSVGGAIERAAGALRSQLLELGSKLFEVSPPLVRYRAGRVAPGGGPDIDAGELVARAGLDRLMAHGAYVNELAADPETGLIPSSTHWHQGAVAVDVDVDVETGRLSVARASAASWAGEVISEAGARLQNDGNVVFGIGSALLEEMTFEDGAPRELNLGPYAIPSILDVPRRLTSLALEAEPDHRCLLHGLGENVLPAVAPAIANAVAAATGARIADLPMTPERVLRALDAVGGAGDGRPGG